MISTQEESPPKVWETAKSSSRSRKTAAFSGVSSVRPEARNRAAISLRRTSAEVMATGIEPRVPQNLTVKRSSGGIERGQRRRRKPGKTLPNRREDVKDHREAADVEDLLDGRLKGRHPERASLGLGLLGGQHEHAEPDAADVLDPDEVEQDPIQTHGAASHVGRERGLETFRARVVDATHGGEHHCVGVALLHQVHVGSPELWNDTSCRPQCYHQPRPTGQAGMMTSSAEAGDSIEVTSPCSTWVRSSRCRSAPCCSPTSEPG